MILFYVLSFFNKGYTIQAGTLFKGGHYLRKYGNKGLDENRPWSLAKIQTLYRDFTTNKYNQKMEYPNFEFDGWYKL